MVRIALGITLALLLATCYFGLQTRSNVLGLRDQLATQTTNANTAKAEAAKAQADFKTSQDNLAKATKDLDDTKTQLATSQSSLDAANKQVADLTSQNADLTKKNADLMAQHTPTVAPVAGGPTPDDMAKLQAQLKDAQAQAAEAKQLQETLTNKAKDAESRADDLQKVVTRYQSGIVRNGLEGEVLAVNMGWNFVVLSIGDRQGVASNAQMILKRGDSEIGKVRVTSVEPSTSVADIIPGSLARGVRVQPGDRVIFPGN